MVSEVQLLAKKEGTYTVYVFRNLETNELIMCTKLPNWNIQEVNINDIGFLDYRQVKAGEEYYNIDTEKFTPYLYSNVYLNNFILKNEILNNKEIIL